MEHSRSPKMDDIAVLVAENLNFDMARIDDEFLDEHALVTESSISPPSARVQSRPRTSACRSARSRMPFPPPPAEALIMTG